ncbi:MAG: hypothetical protein ACK5O2_00585 [Microthrixaceae bacterium]
MEADLQRYYAVDIRDRWLRNDAGVSMLPLRRMWVLISHIPADAATADALRKQPAWSIEAHLLDDLRIVLTSTEKKAAKPHPDRPRPAASRPDPAKVADARRRRAARHRQFAEQAQAEGGDG